MRYRREIADVVGTVVAFGAGLALYVASLEGARHTFLRSWFYAAGPGRNPPWYFMGQDWIDGLWAAGGLLILFVFTILAAGRIGPIAWAAFGINATSFITRIGPAISVWRHSSGIWRALEARTSFTSFEEYVRSQKAASDASFAVAIGVIVLALFFYARALKRGLESREPPAA